MPSKMIREKVAEYGGGPLLDRNVSALTSKFKVSEKRSLKTSLTNRNRERQEAKRKDNQGDDPNRDPHRT
jgi:hypothetical protein